MKAPREFQLEDRRRSLQLKAASQRAQLVRTVSDIQHRVSRFDHGIVALKNLKAKPVLIGAGVAAVALLGPRRLFSWASRGALIASATGKLLRRLR